MLKTFIISLLVAAIFGVVAIIYYYNGGGNEISSIEKAKQTQLKVLGRMYQGNIKTKEFQRHLGKTQYYIGQTSLEANSVFYYSHHPDKHEGEMKVISGIIVPESMTDVKHDSLSFYTINEAHVLRARLLNLVLAPYPEVVLDSLHNYASKNGFHLANPHMQITFQGDSAWSQVLLEEAI